MHKFGIQLFGVLVYKVLTKVVIKDLEKRGEMHIAMHNWVYNYGVGISKGHLFPGNVIPADNEGRSTECVTDFD